MESRGQLSNRNFIVASCMIRKEFWWIWGRHRFTQWRHLHPYVTITALGLVSIFDWFRGKEAFIKGTYGTWSETCHKQHRQKKLGWGNPLENDSVEGKNQDNPSDYYPVNGRSAIQQLPDLLWCPCELNIEVIIRLRHGKPKLINHASCIELCQTIRVKTCTS